MSLQPWQVVEFSGLSRFGGKMAIKRHDFVRGMAAVGASSLIQPKARKKSHRDQNTIAASR